MNKIKVTVNGKTVEQEFKQRKAFAPRQQVIKSKKHYKRKDKRNNKLGNEDY